MYNVRYVEHLVSLSGIKQRHRVDGLRDTRIMRTVTPAVNTLNDTVDVT